MIRSALADLIEKEINYTRLSNFLFIVGLIGMTLQVFEAVKMFWIMFPVLLTMLSSVIMILQFCLKELHNFKNNCKNDDILKYCTVLFPSSNNGMLLCIYVIMVAIYFVCVYRMKFIEMNLMGLYTFILGGSTFFLALISYEVCIRLTVALKEVERNISKITYNNIYPKNTLWLKYLFDLHKILKNAALVISILFVLENSMLCVTNYEKFTTSELSNIKNVSPLFRFFPFEWWVIWVYIFITIVLALPFMTQLQNKSLNKIVSYIQLDFQLKIVENHMKNKFADNPQMYCSILNIIQIVQKSLTDTYFPHRIDRFVSFGASLLTCFAHLTSFCMILIPRFAK